LQKTFLLARHLVGQEKHIDEERKDNEDCSEDRSQPRQDIRGPADAKHISKSRARTSKASGQTAAFARLHKYDGHQKDCDKNLQYY